MRVRVACVFAWACLGPRESAAAPRLEWHAPRECPQLAEMQTVLAQQVGTNLKELDVDVAAAVRIDRISRTGFEARISIVAGGTVQDRVLRDASCPALARASAVVVALAIDPKAAPMSPSVPASGGATIPDGVPGGSAGVEVKESLAPAATSSPAPAPAEGQMGLAQPGAALDSAPNARRRDSSTWHGYLGGGIALVGGVLPDIAPAFALSGGAMVDRWRLGIRLSYAPPNSATLDAPAGIGGRVALASAAVEGGHRMRFSSLEIPLFLGFEVGAFDARGEGVAVSQQVRPLWLGAYAGTGVAFWWTDWLACRIEGHAIAALRQPRFAIQSSDGAEFVFHRPEEFAGRVFLGLEARLE